MDNPLHYAISMSGATFTTKNGIVTTDQTLRRGGITQIGVAFPEAGGAPVFVGDFSGGMPTCDDEGNVEFKNPPPPISKRNYIMYDPRTPGVLLMQPAFNWLDPTDKQDGPAFLFIVHPHGA